jgi:hypothetical protein
MTGVAESGASAVRVLACVVTVAVGVFVVGGCLLSLYFEVVGFGRPRDTGIRPGVVAPLVVGVAVGVLVPAAVCVWVAGGRRRTIVILALVIAIVTAVLMAGVLGMG